MLGNKKNINSNELLCHISDQCTLVPVIIQRITLLS